MFFFFSMYIYQKIKMSIFFGSQSGTAETFAKELSTESKSYGFRPHVYDLEKYDFKTLLTQETFCVFLMATFGEGNKDMDTRSHIHLHTYIHKIVLNKTRLKNSLIVTCLFINCLPTVFTFCSLLYNQVNQPIMLLIFINISCMLIV